MFEQKIAKVKAVYDSGIFDQMVGVSKEKGEPPKILQEFFMGDINFINNELEKNKSNLEIGCGFGRLIAPLAKVSKKIVGIDYSERQVLAAAKNTENLGNVEIKLMPAEKMDFSDGVFDQTLCLDNSLGNMPGIEKTVVAEMKRVTKMGGKIIIRVFSDNEKVREAQFKNYKRLGFTGIKNEKMAVVTNEGFYSRRFSRKNMEEIFNSAGLEPTIKKDGEAGYIAEAVK